MKLLRRKQKAEGCFSKRDYRQSPVENEKARSACSVYSRVRQRTVEKCAPAIMRRVAALHLNLLAAPLRGA